MADANKTEKASGRRRQKLREKGRVARTRELPGGLAVLAVLLVIGWEATTWREQWGALLANLLALAAGGRSDAVTPLMREAGVVLVSWTLPAMALGWLLSVAGHVLQGGFVVAPQALTPDFGKLNPANNLGKLFSFGAVNMALKSLVPIFFITYLCISIFSREWTHIIYAGHANALLTTGWGLDRAYEIAWKAGLVFLAWGAADYFLEKFNFERQIRMSREEVKEEAKETEGNPQTKGRIRRLQRQKHRRFRLRDVARAAVVVTNPTHYAVALEYRLQEMTAPVVIAKGRNLLARKIREEAMWHGIPIVENPPLAQTLYRAVEIGDAIPSKLYAAVAEILAFVFRAQGRRIAAAEPAPSARPAR